MSVRLTMALVVAAIAVGIVVYINPFEGDEESRERSPWFYNVAMEDIDVVSITHDGKSIKLQRGEGRVWEFEDPAGIPPLTDRWSGMTLLLSGPRTRRDLSATKITIDDPAQYGLDNPKTIIDVGLSEGRTVQFRLGDPTTNGRHRYGQVIGFDELFLITAGWGDVLGRLATEPPIPAWYIERDPETITEISVFLSKPESENPSILRFKQKDGSWMVRDFRTDEEDLPVDSEQWAEFIPLLGGPPNLTVADIRVEDNDYAPYGIFDDSRAIEIRFPAKKDELEYNDGVLFVIGSKTPDERWYYGRSGNIARRQAVFLVDVEWTDTLFGLYDAIPYGEVTEPQSDADTG